MKGYMIDVQGTLIDDLRKEPIPGSLEAIEKLAASKTPFVLVTNNTKHESAEFRAFLRGLGFRFEDGQYLDPLMVLESVQPPAPVCAYGSEAFLKVLERRGYAFDVRSPEAVLVAIKPDFSHEEYARMIECVLGGAKLVGMHETSLYVKNGRRYPGVGAILKMIAFATGRGYEVVGKPSRAFFEKALDLLRAQGFSGGFGEVEIVSDDLIGDLAGAKELGMTTSLVLSGKIASVDEIPESMRQTADRVASDIGVLTGVRTRRTA